MYKENLKQDLDKILDVFTGGDGGVSFAVFNMRICDLAKKLDNGEVKEKEIAAAKEIMAIISRFRKTVEIISKLDITL